MGLDDGPEGRKDQEPAHDGDSGTPVDSAEGPVSPEADHGVGPQSPRTGPLAAALAARGVRWGTATAVYVAVVVAVLIGVNLVGSRISISWDVTATHALSLSSASKNILKSLRKPVQITAFEVPGDTIGQQVAVLLAQYKADAHGMVTYQVVDPAADPALAVRDKVTTAGTVVVTSGDNTESVQESAMITYDSAGNQVFSGEGPITDAIIRAAQPVPLTVDFLTGDGEPSISASSNQIPDAVTALKNQGYTVHSLNLLSSNGVPSGVSAVVILSPQHDLSPGEVAALKTYAANGGHLLFLLDPTISSMPNLDGLLQTWGVTPQNDLVVDVQSHYSTDPTTIVPIFGGTAITTPIQQANLATLLPQAQSLAIGHVPSGYTVTPVLTTSPSTGTSPNSWGITDLKSLTANSSLAYRAGKDIPGPLNVAVSIVQDLSTSQASSAASGTGASPGSTAGVGAAGLGQKQFRAVVFGDGAFIASSSTGQANGPINVQGNKDLLLNAVGWLTGASQGIAVRPHASLSNQILLTAGITHVLVDTFIFGVPLLCFALAVGTWWSRRRL